MLYGRKYSHMVASFVATCTSRDFCIYETSVLPSTIWDSSLIKPFMSLEQDTFSQMFRQSPCSTMTDLGVSTLDGVHIFRTSGKLCEVVMTLVKLHWWSLWWWKRALFLCRCSSRLSLDLRLKRMKSYVTYGKLFQKSNITLIQVVRNVETIGSISKIEI